MPHSSMLQLATELRQQIHDLKGEEQGARYKADNLKFKREWKQKQLDDLVEQIAKVEAYEAQQREVAAQSTQ
jgi:hypothetical protein